MLLDAQRLGYDMSISRRSFGGKRYIDIRGSAKVVVRVKLRDARAEQNNLQAPSVLSVTMKPLTELPAG